MNPETPESPAFGDVSAAVEPVRAPGIMSGFAIEELGLNIPCRAATLDAFVTAARALKAAEDAYRAAQQAYAEAVKALSEEAVK